MLLTEWNFALAQVASQLKSCTRFYFRLLLPPVIYECLKYIVVH